MTFSVHAENFAGKPVVDYLRGDTDIDPVNTIYRLSVEYDDDHTATDLLAELLEHPDADRIPGLVIGLWMGTAAEGDSPNAILEALVAAAPQLASLTALFLGDIICEECEVSWLQQTDVSPLWGAYPRLEHFRVRGGNGLSLGWLEHACLKSLAVECGGLPVSVLREISDSKLPELEHLELYLGTGEYGWDGTVDDLQPILSGDLFPKLKYLGLRDSDIADEVAAAVVKSPLLERIEVLDLSLGTLSDEGARTLLDAAAITKLQRLDLHYHFISEELVRRLQALPIDVDVSDPQEGDEDDGTVYRYVSVGE